MISPGIFPLPAQRGGGVEAHLYPLVNALAKLGCEIHLVSDVIDKKYFNSNVVIHEVHSLPHSFGAGFYGWGLNLLTGGAMSTLATLKLLIKRYQFDIIHSHEALSIIAISQTRKILDLRSPLILTVHSPSIRLKAYSKTKEALRRMLVEGVIAKAWQKSDHLIALSSTSRYELINLFGIPAEKVSLIPHGVDTQFFNPDIKGIESVKNKYNIKDPYCLFVGWLSEKKGVQFLLEALVGTRINCVIVGAGPYLKHLKSLSNNLGISNNVIFTGNVSLQDLRSIYAGASFFVFPTLSEASAITPFEAMASGLPVIMTDVPGATDIIEDGYNGFIVKRGNVKHLREMLELLWNDHKLLKEMRKHARKTTEEKFSWMSVAKKTIALYRQLC